MQEAEKKIKAVNQSSELHMIGRLQSNKIKKALTIFDVIQTVDSLKLAEKINKKAKAINKKQRIYCQINIGMDRNKTGFTSGKLQDSIAYINELSNLFLEGLMTILPANLNNEKTEYFYNETKKVQEKASRKINQNLELSMGMSQDYKIAIKCGASFIRVGTNLFGERK